MAPELGAWGDVQCAGSGGTEIKSEGIIWVSGEDVWM